MKSVVLHRIAGDFPRPIGLLASIGRNTIAWTREEDGSIKMRGTAEEMAGIVQHAGDYGYQPSQIQDA